MARSNQPTTDLHPAARRAIGAVKAVLGHRPIAYHASLARALGSVTAGILLSQLLYWQDVGGDDVDGWIWKTRDELSAETALSRHEQETARKVLVRAGVLEEKLRGVPARMHFRITPVHMDRLIGLLSAPVTPRDADRDDQPLPLPCTTQTMSELRPSNQLEEERPSSWPESDQLVGAKPTNQSAAKRPTTPESTPETPALDSSSNRTDSTPTTPALASARTEPPLTDEAAADRTVLTAMLAGFRREFSDTVPARSTTSRILNTNRSAGVSRQRSIDFLFEAAARTRESIALGAVNGKVMAYFLACYEQLVDTAVRRLPPSPPADVGQQVAALTSRPPAAPPPGPSAAAPVFVESHPIWAAVKQAVQAVVSPALFATWVAPTWVVRQEGNLLRIGTSSAFHRQWLDARMRPTCEEALRVTGHGQLHIEFAVVDQSSALPPRSSPQPAVPTRQGAP